MSDSEITTHGFFLIFFKVSSQYISSTLTQIFFFKKKRPKTQKTIVLCIKHQYIADIFTLCVLVHVHKLYTNWITDSRQLFTHSFSVSEVGWLKRFCLFLLQASVPLTLICTAWPEKRGRLLLPLAHKMIMFPSHYSTY